MDSVSGVVAWASVAWYLFLASLLLLTPFIARSRQVLREFALLAGVSTVATALDLLVVALFSLDTFTSLAVAVSLFIFGFGAPLGGSLMDKFGPRRVMLGGLSLIAVGLAAILSMSQLWQFHVWWGLVVGLGTGAIAGTLGATIATRWFNQHRGMVLGVFSAAAAAGHGGFR